MRLLVTGGRDFNNEPEIIRRMNGFYSKYPITLLIHGDARGVDKLAGRWASRRGIQEVRCPANWDYYGRGAGPKRNMSMLDLDPDALLVFPGGVGTACMVKLATDANVPIFDSADFRDWEA